MLIFNLICCYAEIIQQGKTNIRPIYQAIFIYYLYLMTRYAN